MRVTTVASVTEQNILFGNLRKQLLRSLFDRYNLLYPTTRPHDPFNTRHINNNLRNAAADAYRAPSPNANLPQRKQLLHVSFDFYVLLRPTIRSHNRISTIHSNDKRQNAASDSYRAFSSTPIYLLRSSLNKIATTRRIRSLRPPSPHDTLSQPHLHTPHQRQVTKRSSRHVQSISLDTNFSPFFVTRICLLCPLNLRLSVLPCTMSVLMMIMSSTTGMMGRML